MMGLPQADARTPHGDPARWRVTADVEALIWNPHDPTCFLVSSEDGIVAHYDARKGAGWLRSVQAGKGLGAAGAWSCGVR